MKKLILALTLTASSASLASGDYVSGVCDVKNDSAVISLVETKVHDIVNSVGGQIEEGATYDEFVKKATVYNKHAFGEGMTIWNKDVVVVELSDWLIDEMISLGYFPDKILTLEVSSTSIVSDDGATFTCLDKYPQKSDTVISTIEEIKIL